MKARPHSFLRLPTKPRLVATISITMSSITSRGICNDSPNYLSHDCVNAILSLTIPSLTILSLTILLLTILSMTILSMTILSLPLAQYSNT